MPSLDALAVRDKGTIRSISGPDAVVQRILEMGLTEGEEIEVVALAPFGDPIEVRIRGYNLSLRKSEARSVEIEQKADAHP